MTSPFDGEAAAYDGRFGESPVTPELRAEVRRCLGPLPRRLLDLNCGTGTDAVELARAGSAVTAIDLSPLMIERAREKAARSGIAVDFRTMSFDEIDLFPASSFDALLSNFGGLNCAADPARVVRGAARILPPGGVLVLCLLNRTSLWEWCAGAARGRFRYAARRLGRGPSAVPLAGGATVAVRYATLGAVRSWLGGQFDITAVAGLSICSPPPNARAFIAARPRLTRALLALERVIRRRFPWNRLGDHLVVAARRR